MKSFTLICILGSHWNHSLRMVPKAWATPRLEFVRMKTPIYFVRVVKVHLGWHPFRNDSPIKTPNRQNNIPASSVVSWLGWEEMKV